MALVSLPVLSGISASARLQAHKDLIIKDCPLLRSLPDSLLRDPRKIYLINAGVARRELARLASTAHRGVEWGVADASIEPDEFSSLQEAVVFWAQVAADADWQSRQSGGGRRSNNAAAVAEGQALARRCEQTVSAYFRPGVLAFLSKLRVAKQFEYAEMRQGLARRVLELLEAICAADADIDQGVKEELLIRIADSVDACGDKPVLTLNHCRLTMLIAQAGDDAVALRRAGLALMRLGVVHQHALAKINSLDDKDRDDVCVYLRFEIELRDALDLPLTSERMLFPSFVKISDQELSAAAADAVRLTDDSAEFNAWLEAWPPWQRLARRAAAAELRAAWAGLSELDTLSDGGPAKELQEEEEELLRFDGEPMTEPICLVDGGQASGGPWDLGELLDRWAAHGVDFNNRPWSVARLHGALRRGGPVQG